jgi:MoaA/NifB/PqqE/SkfB family radical SAM enzyme
MFKPRHIRKAIACLRNRQYGHLRGRKKLIQFVWPIQCNLNCIMCHQKDIRAQCEPELSLEEIEIMFDNFYDNRVTQVNLVGGEFFINKEKAFAVLDMLKARNLLFSIATNTTLLDEEDIHRLNLYTGLMEIDISLDGFNDTHNKIRGGRWIFNKTVENIKLIKSLGIPVMLVTVVQKQNLKELPELVKYAAEELKVDSMTFVQEYSISQDDWDTSKRLLKTLSGKPVTIFSSISIDDITFKYKKEEFLKYVKEAKNMAESLKFELNTSFDLDKFDHLYDKSARKTHFVECDQLNCTQIDWTGQKNICPFIRIHDLDCGKISEKNKKNYFEDPETEKLINNIKTMGLLPMCSRCCSLKIQDPKWE